MPSSPVMYEGSCLCGRVTIQVEGPPIWAGYCHCETCRTWHAAPVNAVSIWMDETVSVIQGEESMANYQSGISNRHWCRHCGSGLMNRLSKGRTVVYAMVLVESGCIHEASSHINCEEAVLDMHDGVPKYTGLQDSEIMEEPLQTRMKPAKT